MPCYPFVALLLAHYINKTIQETAKPRLYPFIILLIINIVIPIAGYFGIKNEVNTLGYENLAAFLLLLTLAAIVAIYFIRKKDFRKSVLSAFIIYSIFNLIFLNYLYPVIYQQNPLSMTIKDVKKYEKVVSYKIFHPSYTFYLSEKVRVFNELDSLKIYLMENKAAVISRNNFEDDLKSIQLKEIHAVHDLFEGSTTVIYSNSQ
jgi:hypothetical protein